MKDLKLGLKPGVKPDISHVRRPAMVYTARGCEYGNVKYERANYLRPADPDAANNVEHIRAEFVRHRAYLRAAVSHGMEILDAMELHQSTDPNLEDVEGMLAAVRTPDTDPTPDDCLVGPSYLPHHCGMGASFNMAVTQAVTHGLLESDPGVTWSMKEQKEKKNPLHGDFRVIRFVDVGANDTGLYAEARTIHDGWEYAIENYDFKAGDPDLCFVSSDDIVESRPGVAKLRADVRLWPVRAYFLIPGKGLEARPRPCPNIYK